VARREGARPRSARLELADILRACPPGPESLGGDQARVVRDLLACRTAKLGGHLQRCDECGHEQPQYNSCRNRHCPKCQTLDQALWGEAESRHLLPVAYFHQVFTLPPALHPYFRRHPRETYGLLFAAAAEALLRVARRRLGAVPGFIAVLHTWSQTLNFHPHIHLIVTGGGLSLDHERWIASRPNFFLPVRELSKVFRGKLLSFLSQALDSGHFRLDPTVGHRLLRQAAATDWNVYCKPPAAGPEQVLRYLGRYTHRIALGNERLVAFQGGQVTLRYKDRAHGNRRRNLTLGGSELVRRFLLHVVPHRFVRVRHFGTLANNIRSARLATIRRLLDAPTQPEPQGKSRESREDILGRLTGSDPTLCPVCRRGRLHVVADLPRIVGACTRSP
jgi:hypothetical protein